MNSRIQYEIEAIQDEIQELELLLQESCTTASYNRILTKINQLKEDLHLLQEDQEAELEWMCQNIFQR
jgi:uncharacterized coiled-coil DUF342 family protein